MTATKPQQLGEIFKSKREERNITLKEAENATSIRMSHLQAMEQGDLSKIISPVYAQGFVKQYASYLGIDAESIAKEYSDLFQNIEKQEFDYGIGTLEVRNNPISGVKWLPNAMWLLAFIGVIGAAWYFAKLLEVL